jgi:uncharacterized repeat protein (TIGR01451 family)
MSRRLVLPLLLSFAFAMLVPLVAEAQFYPIFQKESAADDDVEETLMGFPPSHPCPDPCNELHTIGRIINCGSQNPDGTCGIPNPQLTGGVFIDELPTTLILDCVRGVTVTGDGTSDPPICDVATNTVTVTGINVDSGGTLEIDFWADVDCENGTARNTAQLEWDQNPMPGTPLQARDPNGGPFGNSGLVFSVGEPGAFTFDKDAPALAISGMPPMRTAPPGSTQRFVLTGGNPSCDTLTVERMQDIEDPRVCLAIDCDSLRMFINDVPAPIPADTLCPDPSVPIAMTLGMFILEPGDTWRLEYNATFTGVGGPECCNVGDFYHDAGPNVQTSDPGLEAPLMPESTCVVLVDAPEPVLDAVKAAEDEFGAGISSIEPGQIIDWRFTITNNGGADGTGDLTDLFPPLALLTPSSIITPFPTGTCTVTGQMVECLGVDLVAGESVEMVVRSTVDCAATGGTFICNEGTLIGPAGSNPTHCPTCPAMAPGNETCVEVLAPAFSFATKAGADADGDGVVDVGETITWTIDPVNNGSTGGANVVVTDTVPAGSSYVPGTLALDGVALSDAADGDDGEVVGATITVRLGDVVPVSGVDVITFDTVVDSVANPEICNDTAAVAWDTAAACPNGSFDIAEACVPTVSAPLVTASKTVDPTGAVERATVLTYSIEACNDMSAAAATGVLVSDEIPAGSTFQNGSMTVEGAALTDAADADAGEFLAGPPASVSILVDDLAPGECKTATFDVAVDGDAMGTISNTGSVSGDGVPPFDTNEVNNDVTVPNPAELSAIKSVVPTGSVDPGATLLYSIDTCNGPMASMARGVVVDDDIPAGTTYVMGSMTLDGAPVTDVADGDAGEFLMGPPASVLVTVGDLDPGTCGTVTFEVTVDMGAMGSVLNTASVSGSAIAPFDTNETDTPIGIVDPPDPPLLTITKASMLQSMPPAMVGDTIAYTITTCNDAAAGPANAVLVTDAIPLDGATGCGGIYVPGSLAIGGVMQTDADDGDQGRYDAAPAPGQILADLDVLDPGECVDVTFEVTIDAGCDDMETVDNVASVVADMSPSMDSNLTSDGVGVIDPPDEPTMMRKEGGPLMNQCPDPPVTCGCTVGNRLDVVADDCLLAGTCTVLDPVSWTIPGDQLFASADLIFYEIDGAGCRGAGDPDDLRVEKSGTDDLIVRLVP